ncbi:RRP15-like protein [Ananas comosus]|uniref:RRP15-like protein n=1 Tax=Ananas comosus TaxID=4615 RepID=A0A199VJE5_ANACO|nr:RRP15-like protein [Ananas comosus]
MMRMGRRIPREEEAPKATTTRVMAKEDTSRRGITRFDEGCRAFRVAFSKIMKKKLPYDALGPMLSAHKKLVVEKLAEEEAEHKAKGDAKKEKILASEKGHVKLASFLDAKEKSLIKIATKGVVRLFNEVSKAQISQRGLNPSRTKVAKELAKQRKQTFSPELKKSSTQGHGDHLPFNSSKLSNSVEKENDDEPGWAPLRDSYMLTSSKLKDWDKMPDPAASAGQDVVSGLKARSPEIFVDDKSQFVMMLKSEDAEAVMYPHWLCQKVNLFDSS